MLYMELTFVPHLPKSRRLPSILRLDLSYPILLTMIFSVCWKMQLITNWVISTWQLYGLQSVVCNSKGNILPPHLHLHANWSWGTCS